MRIVEEAELAAIRQGVIPRHVGVIMDGNGRWAQMRDLSRSDGHAAAEDAVVATVDAALELGVEWLSAYAFSTENWRRDPVEVAFLMRFDEWLLRKSRRDELNEKGVQIRFSGQLDDPRIPADSREWLRETTEMTRTNDRLKLVLAFNYGGRAELIDAVNGLLASGVESVDEQALHDAMYQADMPDLDLVMRTSAEQRLSNFMPWHSVYAEFVFLETLWPDFREWHFYSAVAEFQQRQRRKGAATVADIP
jgi:undecaprenyl diphosphate synthase